MTWEVWFLTLLTSMKQDISYWMYSSCTLLDIKFNQIHEITCLYVYIYIACAYAYLCVYIHVSYHVHTRCKHFRLSFFNVLKAMNVCVQNTVFLRRIGYSFCFYSELGGYISKLWKAKAWKFQWVFSETLSKCTGIKFLCLSCSPPPTSYPLWGKQDANQNCGLIFFTLYLLSIGILESILNQKLFQKQNKTKKTEFQTRRRVGYFLFVCLGSERER